MIGFVLAATHLASVRLPARVENVESRRILEEARARVQNAETIQVTEVRVYVYHPSTSTRWWFRKGGFYRCEDSQGILIASPTKCWGVRPDLKGYKVYPGAQTDWSLSKEIGLGDFGDPAKMPTIGEPKVLWWQGQTALRIEVDGRATMTPQTKLYYYFDPKTHDPIGVSANLGSIDQVRVYKDLKLNPKIEDSKFRFVPPKGWKLVKG